MNTNFTCPICTDSLKIEGKTYRCENNHCFDVSREGYVNLLPANQKKSKSPGDTKEMLRARNDFLSQGYYDALTNAIVEIIRSIAQNKKSISILDSGCGDGHFLSSICRQLSESSSVTISAQGTDISKPALKIAAKLDKEIEWGVASSFKLPITTDSIDILIRMFAPGESKEVVRVLNKNGYFILVTPGPQHLFGLKEVVYASPRPHKQSELAIDGMIEVNNIQITESVKITIKEDLKNLLTMTPYYWNGDREVKEKFDSLTELTTEIDFVVTVYKMIDL